MLPYVVVVGRPNVGKSSFFNACSGHKIAIISDIENTTRDILEYDVYDERTGMSYRLADSGGINLGSDDEVLADVNDRVLETVERADLVLFMIEYDRITALDEAIADMLRKTGKTVYVLANKADNETMAQQAYEQMQFGFDQFFPMSISHRTGFGALHESMKKHFDENETLVSERIEYSTEVKIALIGRPNVGKSSILNAMVGKNRVMVKDEAGTTRDSTDMYIDYDGRDVTLIDTAGIRRPGKIGKGNIEDWSVLRSKRAIGRCDVAAFVIDGGQGITAHDKSIIEYALEENKGIIIIVNKWDLALAKDAQYEENDPSTFMNRYLAYVKRQLQFVPWASVVFTTAIEEKRITEILDAALGIKEERQKRISTGVFNNFLKQMTYKHPPTGNKKSHKPKVYYGSQVDVEPPKFSLSVNNPDHFHFSYKRYLENNIREHFGFHGTPIVIEYKGRGKHKDKTK